MKLREGSSRIDSDIERIHSVLDSNIDLSKQPSFLVNGRNSPLEQMLKKSSLRIENKAISTESNLYLPSINNS